MPNAHFGGKTGFPLLTSRFAGTLSPVFTASAIWAGALAPPSGGMQVGAPVFIPPLELPPPPEPSSPEPPASAELLLLLLELQAPAAAMPREPKSKHREPILVFIGTHHYECATFD